MKILLLGVGRWGCNHLRVLRSLPVEIFVADVDDKRLKDCRDQGIPDSHLSVDPRVFVTQVDAAIVVTPAQSHFVICEELLTLKKDVFVEKPMTLSSREAKVLVELADKNRCILQVGHIFRYDAASQWLYNALRQGEFGPIKMLQGNFSGFKRPRHDTGVVFAQAIHFVDLFNYFMGRPPLRVCAQMKDFMGRGMEDEVLITMDYEDDDGLTWAKVEAGYYTPDKCRQILVIGTQKSASCDFILSPRQIKIYQNKYLKQGDGFNALEGEKSEITFPSEEPLLTELRAFLNSVQTRACPLAGGRDGYESVKVLEAVMESAKVGCSVEIKKGAL